MIGHVLSPRATLRAARCRASSVMRPARRPLRPPAPPPFGQAHQLGGVTRSLVDLGQLDDEVDHLVLEDRRAQIVDRVGVLAVVVDDLALVARVAARLARQRLVQLLLGDRDIVIAADLRK